MPSSPFLPLLALATDSPVSLLFPLSRSGYLQSRRLCSSSIAYLSSPPRGFVDLAPSGAPISLPLKNPFPSSIRRSRSRRSKPTTHLSRPFPFALHLRRLALQPLRPPLHERLSSYLQFRPVQSASRSSCFEWYRRSSDRLCAELVRSHNLASNRLRSSSGTCYLQQVDPNPRSTYQGGTQCVQDVCTLPLPFVEKETFPD